MKKLVTSDKLNLGSGNEYKDGWINLDIDPKWNPDILCNVEKGIPLPNNSINFVYIKHVLEHIDPRKFIYVMSEIRRVCKDKAIVIVYVPYFSCSITYKTIDHLSPMSYYTYDYIDGFKVVKKRLYFFRKSFGYNSKIISAARIFLNPLLSFLPNFFPLIYERLFCWTFPMEELEVVLRVSE